MRPVVTWSILLILLTATTVTAQPVMPPVATLQIDFRPRDPSEQILAAREKAKGKPARTERELLEFDWVRPPNVKFVLIAGCGGGAGGTGRYIREKGWTAGPGGQASPYRSLWIGPLNADRYRVVLGSGGLAGGERSPARNGLNTSFSGTDYTIQFPGATPKSVIEHGVAAALAPDATPPSGGGVEQFKQGNKPLVIVGGGGGDASPLAAGGDGGKRGSKSGSDAKGLSAGGGGAGYGPAAVGGRGGDGYLQIVPLVDLTVVSEQVTRLLKAIAEAQLPLTPAGAEASR